MNRLAMKQIKIFFLAMLMSLAAPNARAATVVYFKNTNSTAPHVSTESQSSGCGRGSSSFQYYAFDTNRGSSAVTATFSPTNASPPCLIQTGDVTGRFLVFASPPLASGITLSGNISAQGSCREEHANANFGLRYTIYRWTSRGAITSQVATLVSPECSTTAGLVTLSAVTPTSTNFSAGDRILVFVQVENQGGTWGANSNRYIDFHYNGLASATGDSYVTFTEDFSFSASTNNASFPVVQ
jgi:hypothetical protein